MTNNIGYMFCTGSIPNETRNSDVLYGIHPLKIPF